MNIWVKAGLVVVGVAGLLAGAVASLLLWQNKAENRRILENYGATYLAKLKELNSSRKCL